MLSRVPDLKVVARNSSFTYKGQPVDVRKVGEELGVTHVLEGSVRKDADRLRIVAQLVDAKTGEHVWAERFDRSGTDPWALQDEVTEKIVAALVGDIGDPEEGAVSRGMGKGQHQPSGVRLLFAQPRFVDAAHARGNGASARDFDRRAIEVSRTPALLKLELGYAYFLRGWNGWSDNITADYQQAGKLVREAIGPADVVAAGAPAGDIFCPPSLR